MTIPKFVVTAGPDGFNALMDIDIDGELDVHPLAGVTGRFTSNLKEGLYRIGANFNPNGEGIDPIGGGLYLVEPIEFVVDIDGKLNGDSGIELLAEAEGIANLQWRISFDRFYLNGKRFDCLGWWFKARGAGETWALESLLSVKQGASWLGFGPSAPKLVGGYFDSDGNLVLENSDDSMLNPIAIPEARFVLVDQHDGGWSLG